MEELVGAVVRAAGWVGRGAVELIDWLDLFEGDDDKDEPRKKRTRTPQRRLAEEEVRAAEQEHGVTFPAEYRAYLLHPHPPGPVNALERTDGRWRWDDADKTRYGLLDIDFPHPDSYRQTLAEQAEREPAETDFPSADDHREAVERWKAEAEPFEHRRTAGAVVLRDEGYGLATLLVVTGAHRGTMWLDARGIGGAVLPLERDGGSVGFERWLKELVTAHDGTGDGDPAPDPGSGEAEGRPAPHP
ncbi:SMI1/KNR4 family protein [Streptomyces sp. NPDC048057]|uniref:SMI1/KNR4 family protein n=1 Tax=Streptomyces sp. NPDC048057 TaxID=3155628 RepID=UPI0033FC9FE4